jgi:hypothetical protein
MVIEARHTALMFGYQLRLEARKTVTRALQFEFTARC